MKENVLNQAELVMANNLKKYRTRLGLRQLDIACKLGFNSTAQLSHWEKGLAVPSLINLFKLAAIYNVAPHELYPKLYNSIRPEIEKQRKCQN